ncbi:hypothetical protein [Neisseria polysaccharea]|uniref:hypothetical protein n=1 Tax=Neisseria polysaccharea TaxID=489 RepID=UPI0027E1E2AD|nr:hypothetical protein [Neisseria polysaccharea]
MFLDRNNDLIYLKRLEDMIMGFWGSAANLAKEAGEGVKRFNERSRKLQNEYQQKSSEKLRRVVKSEGFFGNSAQEKAIARKVLKERGEG